MFLANDKNKQRPYLRENHDIFVLFFEEKVVLMITFVVTCFGTANILDMMNIGVKTPTLHEWSEEFAWWIFGWQYINPSSILFHLFSCLFILFVIWNGLNEGKLKNIALIRAVSLTLGPVEDLVYILIKKYFYINFRIYNYVIFF